jgi:hypothetical protein
VAADAHPLVPVPRRQPGSDAPAASGPVDVADAIRTALAPVVARFDRVDAEARLRRILDRQAAAR